MNELTMTANHHPTLISQAELLLHSGSNDSTSFDGLHVTRIHHLAAFDFINTYFRTDHFSVMLITDGSVNASVNFHPFSLAKNGLAVTSPHAIKKIVNASASAEGMAITFTLNFLAKAGITKRSSDLLTYFGSNGIPNWQLHAKDAAIISSLMENLFARCSTVSAHLYGKEQLYHTFAIFLYEVAAQSAKYADMPISKLTRKEDLVVRFADLVSKNVRDERKVQFYADKLNVTPKYLTETVKEISGKNAGEIIDDFVIVESKLLLENPDYSVAQISSMLNFADASFFGKYFKRLTGLSPKEFRTNLFI
jgi:AraC-like DNA-binding protein